MNTFNIISGICSICSLFVSIFIATKVIKINTKSVNKSKMSNNYIEGSTVSGRDSNVKDKE